MKKFSKMLALGLAAALVFGMTVSAAGSPTADQKEEMDNAASGVYGGSSAEGYVETSPIEDYDVFTEAVAAATSQDRNGEILEALELTSETATVAGIKMVKTFEVSKPANWSGKPVAVSFYFDRSLFDITSKYVLVHITEDGGTEVLPVTVVNSGWGDVMVTATFTSFSPVVLAQVTMAGPKGEDGADGKDGQDGAQGPQGEKGDKGDKGDTGATGAAGTSATNPATAPKTGEAAPVAGIMALILMAGAVICAGRVRYNR